MRSVPERRGAAGARADSARPADPGVTTMSDTDITIDTVESKLDRVKDADRHEALELLRSARSDLETLDADGSVDDAKVGSLATHVDQRIREVQERDEYSGGMGAAMNPESDEAP